MNNKLVHYSRQSGLKTLDPEFMGTGAPSEELRQGPVQTKQTSFYREGTEPESVVTGGAKSKYIVNLGPEHKLYDIYEDPEGLVTQSVKQAGRINTDHIRGTLKNAGYHGFYTSHPSYSKQGVVNIFHSMPISSEEELNKADLQKEFITIKSEEPLMKPYHSEVQRRWAHTATGTKALGGEKAVKEWDAVSRDLDLPEKMAKSLTQGFYRSKLKQS